MGWGRRITNYAASGEGEIHLLSSLYTAMGGSNLEHATAVTRMRIRLTVNGQGRRAGDGSKRVDGGHIELSGVAGLYVVDGQTTPVLTMVDCRRLNLILPAALYLLVGLAPRYLRQSQDISSA